MKFIKNQESVFAELEHYLKNNCFEVSRMFKLKRMLSTIPLFDKLIRFSYKENVYLNRGTLLGEVVFLSDSEINIHELRE